MALEVWYFDGCPHWQTTAERLYAAQQTVGCRCPVELRKVDTAEQAEAFGFAGSPTVVVHGRDPFTANGPARLACRLYPTPRGPAGSPTVQQLASVITCP